MTEIIITGVIIFSFLLGKAIGEKGIKMTDD